MEIAIAAALALVVGLLGGFLWGKNAVQEKSDQEVTVRDKEVQRLKSELGDVASGHEEKLGKLEEERGQELEKLRGEVAEKDGLISRLKGQNANLETEARKYRGWASDQIRLLADHLSELWRGAGLPDTVQELASVDSDDAKPQLVAVAGQLQRWMRESGVGGAEELYHVGLGRALEGRYDEAAEAFQDAALKGMGGEAWLALGDVLWLEGRREKAREAYRHCLNAKDLPDYVYRRTAEVAVERREYKEAVTALEKLLEKRRNPVEVYALAGLAYGKLEQDKKAVEVCERGLKQHKASSELLAKMIVPLSRLGKTDQVQEIYEEARDVDPDSPEVPFSMGVARMKDGDLGGAQKHLEEALTLRSEYPEAYYCLGVIHNSQGHYKKALECFQRAVTLKPDYAEAFYHMKDSYEGLRDFDKAVAVLKKATRLNPDYS